LKNKQTGKPRFAGEILLCEDSKMNQEVISARLAKVGLKTIVAENGREGLELVAGRGRKGLKPFDLIFMDIHMPVMDGLEAASEIAKLNTGTPIIAMTPNSGPAEREQYLARGMSDCLGKPFTSQELMGCLVKYMTPAGYGAAAPSAPEDEAKLKTRLINAFMRNNKTVVPEIRKALDNGEVKLAHRLAHTLKGNAGLLGRERLQKAAQEVESLLMHEQNLANQVVLGDLEAELDAVFKELTPLVAPEVSPGAGPGPEPLALAQTRGLFEELEALLDGGNPECLNLIGSLRRVPGSGALIQHLEYFEFEQALSALARLKKELP
jgi:CheY-like chemotaxis protein